jgi:hypothetical protein
MIYQLISQTRIPYYRVYEYNFSYIGDCIETDEVIATVLTISPETNMYYHQSLYQIQMLIQILLILRNKK